MQTSIWYTDDELMVIPASSSPEKVTNINLQGSDGARGTAGLVWDLVMELAFSFLKWGFHCPGYPCVGLLVRTHEIMPWERAL